MTLLDAENAQEHQMILARNCRQHLARLMTLRYGPHPEIDNLGHAAAEGTGYRLQVIGDRLQKELNLPHGQSRTGESLFPMTCPL